MSIFDIFRISSIKAELIDKQKQLNESQKEITLLNATLEESGAKDLLTLKKLIEEHEENLSLLQSKVSAAEDLVSLNQLIEENKETLLSLRSKISAAEKQVNDMNERVKTLKESIVVLEEEELLESFALYKPKFTFMNSSEYKQALTKIRAKQKEFIKTGSAAISNGPWTVNNSVVQGRKMVDDMKKLLLRSFNNECDYCVDNVKFNNIERFRLRIEKSFDAVNKLGRVMQVKVSHFYKELKLEELMLAFEYEEKKQEDKENARRLREEQREQRRVEQEIRAAREKITKERKHFQAALAELNKKLSNSDQQESQDIQAKIEEISGKLADLESEEKIVDYRENNAKAGYVYIISNIGAFGEDVYKIGMTRRLEPMERVQELGDASVPFAFDVHAMIFSDDAPALEAKLHNHFWERRLNKINGRKEFFKADLKEIEAVVRENYDRVFDMVHKAPAEHYREGLMMQRQPTPMQ